MTQAEERRGQDRLLRNVLFAFFVSGTAAQPLGSFVPFLRETYGFRYDLSGWLLSCQSIGNAAAIVLAGILPALLGRRRSILVTSVWMAGCYGIFASGIGAPWLLLCACLMNGIARGGNSNFSNTMISTLPEERAARGFNLLHGSYAIGALLSPAVLVLCATRWPGLGWRVMAAGLAVLCLVQLAVYAKMPLPREEGAEKGLKTLDLSFLKVRQFWVGGVMLFFYVSTEYAIVGWLVTYFQDAGILAANQAQLMNSLLWLVIFCGRMLGAALSGRVGKTTLLLVDGVGMFAFFLLMFFSRTPALVTVGLMGTGFFMATIYPLGIALTSDSIRGNDLGCSILLFTGAAGGIITPALVGVVAQGAGIRAGMGLVVVYAALLMAVILINTVGTAVLVHRDAPEEK